MSATTIDIPLADGSNQHIKLVVRKEANGYNKLKVAGYEGYLLVLSSDLPAFSEIKKVSDLLEKLKEKEYGAEDIGRFIIQEITRLNPSSSLLKTKFLIDWYGPVVSMPTDISISAPGLYSQSERHTFLASNPVRTNNSSLSEPLPRPNSP